jgi:lysozyme family protein
VLAHEGSYINHPKDPGGETNYGVTKRVAVEYGYHGDMRHIPMEIVVDIYYTRYWRVCSCDALPAGVDYSVFDCAVNHGTRQARKFLQRAVGAKADGFIGPQTLAAIGKADPVKVMHAIRGMRLSMVQRLKTWATFGRGWERRYKEVLEKSLAMHSRSAVSS